MEFQSNYTDKQIDQILQTINSRPVDELSNFDISKQRIKKIEIRKQKQGEFASIEEILELDGFGVKVLEKFCDSILGTLPGVVKQTKGAESDTQSLLSKKKQQFVSPALLDTVRKSITSCVSFYVDLNSVAWTKLTFSSENDGSGVENPICIDEWMCYEVGNDDKKLSLSDLIEVLITLNNKIPYADVYVVEAQQMPQAAKQPGSPVQMNFNIQKAQFLAMLSILMASRESSVIDNEQSQSNFEEPGKDPKMPAKRQQNIFFLRNFLSSRLYKTFVGNERVATEQVVEKLLRYNYSPDQPNDLAFDTIDVPQHLREYFFTSGKIDKEYMGQSLLVGLTFVNLCILKCAQSTAMLNKQSNRSS